LYVLPSESGRFERVVAIERHKSTVKNVSKRTVCNERIAALKLGAEPVVCDNATIGL